MCTLIITSFMSCLVSGLKANAFKTVIQCSRVAEAQPKQFPSLRGAAERGRDKEENGCPSSDMGVRGVAGSLVLVAGETISDCSFVIS